jgi:hypothetical protein
LPVTTVFALVWLSALPSFANAQQPSSDASQGAVLEGTVVHAVTKEPIRKARVTLEPSAREHEYKLVATSDEAGHFRFVEVKPDTYRLSASKAQFIDGSYGQAKPKDPETLLKVGADDRLRELTLRMFPAGVIAGRVVDADGEPVSGESVILSSRHGGKQGFYSHVDDTTTNQNGEYEFRSVLPGRYFVGAGDQQAEAGIRAISVDREGNATKLCDLWTFYPAALRRENAQPIRVESGQQQTGIDVHLQRGSMLTIKGRIAGGIDPSAKMRVSAYDDTGTSEEVNVAPNGEFTMELPPGTHKLTLIEQAASGVLRGTGVAEVDVADQDVAGVLIKRFQPAEIQVRAVVEGEEDHPLTMGTIQLIPDEPNGKAGRNTFGQYERENGSFRVHDVFPGKYRVWFSDGRNYGYLKSLQSSGHVIEGDVVDVADGANLNLVLVYSRKVGSVSGDVEVPERVDASVNVVLLLEDYAEAYGKIRFASADQAHHFSDDRLRPGKYLAFALEENDFELWDNEDFVKQLESEGTAIELHEGEQRSIHLKLIPKDVIDRIRQQLGL